MAMNEIFLKKLRKLSTKIPHTTTPPNPTHPPLPLALIWVDSQGPSLPAIQGREHAAALLLLLTRSGRWA